MWEGRNGDGDKIVKRDLKIKRSMRMMIDKKINDVKINKGWYESVIRSKNEDEEK